MEYSSILYYLVTNPNAQRYEETRYNSNIPTFIFKDNTVFMGQGIFGRDHRVWLEQNGIDLCEECTLYHPVIKLENGIVTTWETFRPNVANHFLQMDKSTREAYYPMLNFVEIGNHPYSRDGRFRTQWLIEQAQRESHRIIYPHYDPKQHFLLPKDFGY